MLTVLESPPAVQATRTQVVRAPATFKLPNQRDSRRTRFFVATLVSIVAHLALLFSDRLWTPAPRPVAVPVVTEVVRIEIPFEPEPLEIEVMEVQTEAMAEAALAPPMLPDIPQSVNLSLFTQPIQPPPPPGVLVSSGAVHVPLGRGGRGLSEGMGTIFDINNIDQPPLVRNAIQPNYPLEMRRVGTTGYVVVEFVVDREGNVQSVAAIQSTHIAFVEAAISAVQRWKFRPGKNGGRTVNTRVRQTINFSLDAER